MAKKKKSGDDQSSSSSLSSAPDLHLKAIDSSNKKTSIFNSKETSMNDAKQVPLQVDSSCSLKGKKSVMVSDNLLITGEKNEVRINNIENEILSKSKSFKDLMPDDIQQIVLGDLKLVTVGRHENAGNDEQHSWHGNFEEENIICDAMEVDSESHIEDEESFCRQDAQVKSFDDVQTSSNCDGSMSEADEGEESYSDQRLKRGSDAQRTAEYLEVQSGIITISRESDGESSAESDGELDIVAQCADSISAVLGFSDQTIFSVNIAKDNSDDEESVVDGEVVDFQPCVEVCTEVEEIDEINNQKKDEPKLAASINDVEGSNEVSSTVRIYSHPDSVEDEPDELDYEPELDKYTQESDSYKVGSNPSSYDYDQKLCSTKEEPKPDVLEEESKLGVLKDEQKMDSLEDEPKPDSLGGEYSDNSASRLQNLIKTIEYVSSSDMVFEVEPRHETIIDIGNKLETGTDKSKKTKSSSQKSRSNEVSKKSRSRKESLDRNKSNKTGRAYDKEPSVNKSASIKDSGTESKLMGSSQSSVLDDKKSKELLGSTLKPIQEENALFDVKAVIEEDKLSEFRSRSGSTDTTGSESGSSSSCRRSNRIKKPLVSVKSAATAADDSMPSPSRSSSSLMNHPSPVSTFSSSSTTVMPEQGFDADKPVKVKSRWRRTSELEMVTRHLSSSSSSAPSNIIKPIVDTSMSSTDSSTAKDVKEETIEDRLSQFVQLASNEYRTARSRSKEARRMVCDCTLSKEEITRGEKGCGDDCLNRLLMIECGSRCVLGDNCLNKRFQNFEYADVEVIDTERKGLGLRAMEDIPEDTFLLEYVGEVVDPKEFRKRAKEYAKDKNRHYYFMALKYDAIIDATQKGNISRFINHGCDPNAETQKWTVNGELRIGFFSKRAIKKGEEITFDYRLQRYGKEAQRCYCQSASCRGWIGEEPEREGRWSESSGRKERKEKKKKRDRDLLNDIDLVDEVDKLLSSGLKNRAHTLTLCRVMIRIEEPELRSKLLRLLRHGDTACQRLFLDYHGLGLIWSWMMDSDLTLNKEILETLAKLPIPNKTMLQESKVLGIVEKWASPNERSHLELLVKRRKERSPSAEEDSETLDTDDGDKLAEEQNKLNSQPKDAEKTEPLKPSDEDSKTDNETNPEAPKPVLDLDATDLENITKFSNLAAGLLEEWKTLKEVYKIPKKERIEQMKEHEREADLGYRERKDDRKDRDRDRHYTSRWDKSSNDHDRRDRDRDRDRDRHRDRDRDRDRDRKRSRESPDSDRHAKGGRGDDRNPSAPKMSKSERRQLFMQKVEEEERQKKEQEELWQQHQEQCIALGVDPNQTAAFDPQTGFPCYFDPQTQTWQPYPSEGNVPPDMNNPNSLGFDPSHPPPTYPGPPNMNFPQGPPGHVHHPMQFDGAPPYQAQMPPNQYHPAPYPMPYQGPAAPLGYPPNMPTPQPYQVPPGSQYPPNAQPGSFPPQADYTAVAYQAQVPAPSQFAAMGVAPQQFQPQTGQVYPGQMLTEAVGAQVPASAIDVATAAAAAAAQAAAVTTNSISAAPTDDVTSSVVSVPSAHYIPPAPVPVKLPPKWKSAKDAEGRTYYYHVKTRVSQWEPPIWDPQQHQAATAQAVESEDESSDSSDSDDDDSSDDDDDEEDDEGEKNEEEEEQDDEEMEYVEDNEIRERDAELESSFTDQFLFDEAKKRRDVLVQERIISPRSESEKSSYDKKRYRKVKEKLRRQKAKLKEKLRKEGKHSRRHSKSKSASKCEADTSSDPTRKIKDNFRLNMAGVIVHYLNPYRKPDCKLGRITCNEDFKHLARKLTHFVMLKELKHCQNIDELQCNDNVKHKARDFIKKYMAKYGETYQRPSDED